MEQVSKSPGEKKQSYTITAAYKKQRLHFIHIICGLSRNSGSFGALSSREDNHFMHLRDICKGAGFKCQNSSFPIKQ